MLDGIAKAPHRRATANRFTDERPDEADILESQQLESKQRHTASIQRGCPWCKASLTAALVLLVAIGWAAHQLSYTRCYLIDWNKEHRIDSIPIVSSQAELDRYIGLHQPALLLGQLRDWPATHKWSPAYFARLLPKREVEVYEWGRCVVFGSNCTEPPHFASPPLVVAAPGWTGAAPRSGR